MNEGGSRLFPRIGWVLSGIFLVVVAVLGYVLFSKNDQKAPVSEASRAPQSSWVLRDTASTNLTTMDPIQMVDAFSVTTLSHVYEGLVKSRADGAVVPALARKWEVSKDGRQWTFFLRKGVFFHSVADSCPALSNKELTSADVVYSLKRAMTGKGSFYKWAFAGLIKGGGSSDGGTVEGLSAPSPYVVVIRLKKSFPLLNRLVTVAGWVYPDRIVETCGKDFLSQHPVGTGPYYLERFIPDDRIVLSRFKRYYAAVAKESPEKVDIYIVSEAAAALEAFKAGRVDVLELSLGTMKQGRRLAKTEGHHLVSVNANNLDYLVVNNKVAPYNDVRVRRALNLAIDREGLSQILEGAAEPAYGYIPPASPAFRGKKEIREKGYAFDPKRARALLSQYLKEKGKKSLSLTLTVEAGELPEIVAQYVQANLKQNLGIDVRLAKVTWPEMIQIAFGGKGTFFHFWWTIVTPSEDLYFLFFFPGSEPPNGFNVSFYNNPNFIKAFDKTFAMRKAAGRYRGVRRLEDFLIKDAAAIPLFHKVNRYLVRRGIDLPISGFLFKDYEHARRKGASR